MATFRFGSARSVGARRVLKDYVFLDGTFIQAKSAAAAMQMAGKTNEVPAEYWYQRSPAWLGNPGGGGGTGGGGGNPPGTTRAFSLGFSSAYA